MSLARDLIDAALAADLTQNELRVFLALFRQTLCYGKTADPLTLKRLAKLTHIRKDRLIPAIASVLDKGLFDAYPHPIFEHEYRIPPSFQATHAEGFFTPALPKNRENFRFPGDISEKREHTALNLTAMNLTPTTTPPQSASVGEDGDNVVEEPLSTAALPYPSTFNQQELTSAARILDGLNPQDAHDCLRLLNAGMQTNKVKSPLGYLHKLVQAARQNKLDRSTLQVTAPTEAMCTATIQQARLRVLANEIRGLDVLFACAGIPLDALNAATRATWLAGYNALREQMLPTDVVEKAC